MVNSPSHGIFSSVVWLTILNFQTTDQEKIDGKETGLETRHWTTAIDSFLLDAAVVQVSKPVYYSRH